MAYPSQYKDEYPDLLIEHMGKEGLSFESFGGKIGVSYGTLYRWVREKSDFAEAKGIGELASLLYWEERGRDGIIREHFKAPVWIYTMKARFAKFGWRDADAKRPDEDDDESKFRKKLASMSPEELAEFGKKEFQLLVESSAANGPH
jgi:hypothetical protein